MSNYTKNIPNKLKLIGFNFKYDQSIDPDSDPDLKYEVWTKGEIEVTIDHTERIWFINLYESEELKCTLYELKILDRVINKQHLYL